MDVLFSRQHGSLTVVTLQASWDFPILFITLSEKLDYHNELDWFNHQTLPFHAIFKTTVS